VAINDITIATSFDTVTISTTTLPSYGGPAIYIEREMTVTHMGSSN